MPAIDVFLSHARTDFDAYGRPLAEACRRRSISLWLDQAQIGPGESLTEAIGRGLQRARYVLVLITDAFLERNWTAAELRNALSREIDTGETVVLPVIVAPRDQVLEQFPLLRDKLHLDWSSRGADGVADDVAKLLARRPNRWWTHMHDQGYVGEVWTRVQPTNTGDITHETTLLWGPLRHTISLRFTDGLPISLTYDKLDKDEIGIYAIIDGPAVVSFGEGSPPDPPESVIDIRDGWIRVAGAPRVRATVIDDSG